jgi:hypothetical protein
MRATFSHGATSPSGPTEATRSHSYTPHSVLLLWTGDQPDAETPS